VQWRSPRFFERNDRIFLIPEQTDIESELTEVRKLSKRAKQDLKHFFEGTDALDNKKLEFIGWGGPAAVALRL
jgi:inorganic pyrophosphatase